MQYADATTTFAKPRRAWLAALLSLLAGGPLGQVYVGHLRRSLGLWYLGSVLLVSLTTGLVTLPIGRTGLALLMACGLAYPGFLAVDAFLLARRDRDAPLKSYQRWWVYALAYLVFLAANYAVAYATRSFYAEAFVVPTRAMAPTILPGDRILVDKLNRDPGQLRRHDVVVFRSAGPGSPPFVMRVVGLPGETIEIRNERVLIDDKAIDDEHAVFDGALPPYVVMANYGPAPIPSDCFFVLGDNRRLAKDSRFLGPIPLSDFHGKARMIYWSQPREFPDPNDTSRFLLGPIRWDRMGTRLD